MIDLNGDINSIGRHFMEIQISHGKGHIPIQIQDEKVLGIFHSNPVDVGNEINTLLQALQHPIESLSFLEFLQDAHDVLIIVNDATRPTPTSKVLEIISDQIQDLDVRFMVATGNHRGPTDEEFQFIFGSFYEMYKDRIHVHMANKHEDMVYLGTSKSGTEIHVNKMGVEAHKLVVIGSVEPHYFAGYTGGRKFLLPGITSYRTIEQNHKGALLPEARLLGLDGNPVHEDMIEALNFIKDKEIFSIQTVLDRDRRIYAATAGDIHASFNAAIEKADQVYAVEVPEKADIVVTVAPFPMNIDLYQSQKTLETGKLALNQDGILIMVSQCRMGIGDETFMELLTSAKNAVDVLERIQAGYVLGYHKAAKLAEISLWAEMWAKTDLPPDVIESVYMKPIDDLQEAINTALERKGEDAKVLFLMEGSVTVPIIR
jgi:nickel-dependent lactate racemase